MEVCVKDEMEKICVKDEMEEIYDRKIREYESENANLMCNHALILALSIMPGVKEYKINFPGEEEAECYGYQLEPVPRYLMKKVFGSSDTLEIIMLCTNKTYKDENNYSSKDLGDITYENCTVLDFFIAKIKKYAEKVGFPVNNLKFKIIKADDNLNAINAIVEELEKMQKENDDLKIYVDIHGGLRGTQDMLNTVLSMSQYYSFKIENKDVFTVNSKDGSNTEWKIDTVKEILAITKVASAIGECINTGYAEAFHAIEEDFLSIGVNKFEERKVLIDILSNIARSIQFCNVEEFNRQLGSLKTAMEEIERKLKEEAIDSLMKLLYPLIKNSYGKLLEDHTVIDEIEWCVEKGFMQQALTLIESKMPAEFIKNKFFSGGCLIDGTRINLQYLVSEQGNPSVKCTVKELVEDEKEKRNIQWKAIENYMVEQIARRCVEKEGNPKKGKYVSLGADYSVVDIFYEKRPNQRYYRNIRIVRTQQGNQEIYFIPFEIKGFNENPNRVTEEFKQINRLMQLHMSLKNERNKINHASTEGRADYNVITGAVLQYIQLFKSIAGIRS